MPIVLIATLSLLLALAAPVAQAADEDDRVQRLTVSTSLGAPDDDDERAIRARGTAPKGSRIHVRFYRGSRHLFTRRTTTRGEDGRYSASHRVDRTGDYRVRVTAVTRTGARLRVTARLTFAPVAEAPSAPEAEESARRPA